MRDVAEKVKDAEVKGRIADLNLELSDFKMQVAELQTENHDMRARLNARDDISDLRVHLERRDGVYVLKREGRDPGPHCPQCLDVDCRLVPVTKFTGAFTAIEKYN